MRRKKRQESISEKVQLGDKWEDKRRPGDDVRGENKGEQAEITYDCTTRDS